jgi:hypothetical protein
MPANDRRVTYLSLFATVVAAGAIALSIVALSNQVSSAPNGPRSGVYLNGPVGQPHYAVSLTTQSNGTLRGALDYVYQDGQTSVIFTFKGFAQAADASPLVGLATVEPVVIPQSGSAVVSGTPPSAISVTYGSKGLSFGECSSYLQVSSLAQCQFSFSTAGTV